MIEKCLNILDNLGGLFNVRFLRELKNLLVSLLIFLPLIQYAQSPGLYEISGQLGLNGMAYSDGIWGNGMSMYDWDWDGYDDLVLLSDSGVKFFKNNQGSFAEIDLNVNIVGELKSICWVDFDNDDDPDLAISQSNGPFKLYRNEGDFQLTDISELSSIAQFTSQGYGQSWGDFDKDGYLDLYLSIYNNTTLMADTTNFLYRSNGDGSFTDVTEFAQVGNDFQPTFLSVWIDLEGDGWLDIYLINDRENYLNAYYKNNGDGTFTNLSTEVNLREAFDPMCITVGDFNNDTHLDMYVTNTFLNEGNHLYENLGNGTFQNVAAENGLQMLSYCWGSAFIDYDGDLKQDVIVANSQGFFNNNDITLFKNTGLGFEIFHSGELFNTNGICYALDKGDINNDGKPEIATLGRQPEGLKLWETQGFDYNYLKIALKGNSNNRDAIGSVVQVFSNAIVQTQWTMSSESYITQNSQWHFFSLAEESHADSVKITWPNGHVEVLYNVQANQALIIEEGMLLNVQLSPNQNTTLCPGESLIINAGAWDSYVWSTGETSQTINVSEPGEYFVTVYQGEDSVNSDTIIVDFYELGITNSLIYEPTCFDANDGTAALLTDNNEIIEDVLWNNLFLGSVIENLSSGELSYQFNDDNGCLVEGIINIQEPDSLTLELSINVNEALDPCEGTWFGSAEISGGIEPYEINWEFYALGESEPYETEDDISFNCFGINQVTIVVCEISDNNECRVSKEMLIQPVSLNETASFEFNLYPNPIEDRLFIQVNEDIESIKLYDLSGRVLFEIQPQSQSYSTDASWLQSGSYVIEIQLKDLYIRKMIIKN